MTDSEFIQRAEVQFGFRGKQQAIQMVMGIHSYRGIDDGQFRLLMESMQQAFFATSFRQQRRRSYS